MYRLIHWYNIHRKSIWKIIIIIIAVIAGIQLVSYVWRQTNSSNQNTTTTQNVSNSLELNSITLEETKSVVTGDSLSNNQISMLETLDTFVEYCNDGNIDEAYSLLSNDCKEQVYTTVDSFEENYYNNIFTGEKKSINVENWYGNIYKVEYIQDALSTGTYDTSRTIQDYITLIQDDDGNTKLNINSYIGKTELNVEETSYDITIKVVEKNTYMDYETYTFEIKNNTENTILMSNLDNLKDMYLLDSNELKYAAYTHELSEAELRFFAKETRNVTIKYYNKYSSSREITEVVFSNIILNYDDYSEYSSTTYYQDYATIEIDL